MKRGDKVKVNELGANASRFKKGQEVVFTGDYAFNGLWGDFKGVDSETGINIRQYLDSNQYNVLVALD